MTEPTPSRAVARRSTALPRPRQTSSAPFFAVSVVVVVLWLPTIALFSSIDTWQLVINTATPVLAFLLIALPQNSERRTDRATNQKLDVLTAGFADLLAIQVDGGDRETIARRIVQLRSTIRVEESI